MERGRIPDFVLRMATRATCRKSVGNEPRNVEEKQRRLMAMVAQLSEQPLAIEVDAANFQHYEVSTPFFLAVLGKRMKYSSCVFPEGTPKAQAHLHLDAAEEAMLALTCQRAQLAPGQRILELGCGWGSLSLYMAEHFPECQIIAVSNSRTQKAHIDAQAQLRGFQNLTVITADMNHFAPDGSFDRIVSVEMFEHMRNYGILFDRLYGWLNAGGKLFFHIFTYRGTPSLFEVDDPNDWLARHFFAGGTMPSTDLPFYFQGNFQTESVWRVNGWHYQLTLEAWLQKMDRQKAQLYPLFEKEYGTEAGKFWHNWRIFFLVCAEVFGYDQGNAWFVSHYLWRK